MSHLKTNMVLTSMNAAVAKLAGLEEADELHLLVFVVNIAQHSGKPAALVLDILATDKNQLSIAAEAVRVQRATYEEHKEGAMAHVRSYGIEV